MFFVQINHTGKGFLFLIFREIKLRKYSSLHKLFYGLKIYANSDLTTSFVFEANKKKKSMKLADVNFLVVPNCQNGFNVWYKGNLFTTDSSNLNLFKSMWDEMINKTVEANNHGI